MVAEGRGADEGPYSGALYNRSGVTLPVTQTHAFGNRSVTQLGSSHGGHITPSRCRHRIGRMSKRMTG